MGVATAGWWRQYFKKTVSDSVHIVGGRVGRTDTQGRDKASLGRESNSRKQVHAGTVWQGLEGATVGGLGVRFTRVANSVLK